MNRGEDMIEVGLTTRRRRGEEPREQPYMTFIIGISVAFRKPHHGPRPLDTRCCTETTE